VLLRSCLNPARRTGVLLPPHCPCSDKYGLVYVITKLGLLFVYDLESATAVYRTRMSQDPIFLAAPAPGSGGFTAINRCVRRGVAGWQGRAGQVAGGTRSLVGQAVSYWRHASLDRQAAGTAWGLGGVQWQECQIGYLSSAQPQLQLGWPLSNPLPPAACCAAW
jgi:hypothetical protein